MKLYVFPVAPNPTRVRLYLAEKSSGGAEFDIQEVMVNLPEKQQQSREHLKRNPLAKLPVLEIEDGVYLTESLAIIEYLEELVPDPPMIVSEYRWQDSAAFPQCAVMAPNVLCRWYFARC